MASNFTAAGNTTHSFSNSTLSGGNMTGMAAPAPLTEDQIKGMLTYGLILEIYLPQYWDTDLTALVDDVLNGKHGNLSQWLNPITKLTTDPTPTLLGLQAYLKTVPHNNSFWHMATIYIVLQVLTLFTLLIRWYARKTHSGRLRPEDFWAVLSFGFSICYVIGLILGSIYGKMGYHLWDLTWNQLRTNLLYMFAVSYFYPACMFSVKMALVSFYWSLSPNKTIRRILIGVFVLILCNFIIANLMLTFACRPVAWWKHILTAKCVNRIPMNTAWGVLNIISDIALWFLPVPAVWRLQLRFREKIGLIIMFGIGSIACIAAIIRLVVSNRFFKSTDITWGEAEISLWALLEIDLAIMLLSAPAFKIVLMKHAPTLIGYTKRMTSRNNSKTSSNEPTERRESHGRRTPKRDDGRGGILTIGSAKGFRGDNSKITSKQNTEISMFADEALSPVTETGSPTSPAAKRLSALGVINPFQERDSTESTEGMMAFPSPPPRTHVGEPGFGLSVYDSPSSGSSLRASGKEKDDSIKEKDFEIVPSTYR